MNDSLKLSKTLSHLLRHEPEVYGLSLAAEGWVQVDALLRALAARVPPAFLRFP
jgi:RNA:NAD 2'-phosphotransferase (TPT1/KptA family)